MKKNLILQAFILILVILAATIPLSVRAEEKSAPVRVESATNRVFIIDNQNNQFFIFDAEKREIISRTKVGQAPIDMTLNSPTNRIYVLSEKDETVAVIDGRNGRKIAVLKTGKAPKAIKVSEKTNKVYVTNYGDNTLSVINGEDNSVKQIEAGWGPTLVAVDQERGLVFVVSEINHEFYIFDAATDENIARRPLGLWPKGLTVDAANKRVYVSSFLNNSVAVLDYSDLKSLKEKNLKTGKGPLKMAVNLNSRDLYVVNYNDAYLSVFDKQGKEKPKIELGEKIVPLVLNSLDGRIYAVGKDEPAKLKIWDIANQKFDELTFPSSILGLASIAQNDKIYASQLIDGRLNLAVVDGKTREINYYPLVYSFVYENMTILIGAGALILLIAIAIIIYLFFIKKRTD